MRAVFSLCSKLFLTGALLFSAFLASGLKLLTELSAFKKRYEFLRCMGMKEKVRKRSIAFEVRLLYRISTGTALFMAVVYMLSFVYKGNIYDVKGAAGENAVLKIRRPACRYPQEADWFYLSGFLSDGQPDRGRKYCAAYDSWKGKAGGNEKARKKLCRKVRDRGGLLNKNPYELSGGIPRWQATVHESYC